VAVDGTLQGGSMKGINTDIFPIISKTLGLFFAVCGKGGSVTSKDLEGDPLTDYAKNRPSVLEMIGKSPYWCPSCFHLAACPSHRHEIAEHNHDASSKLQQLTFLCWNGWSHALSLYVSSSQTISLLAARVTSRLALRSQAGLGHASGTIWQRARETP